MNNTIDVFHGLFKRLGAPIANLPLELPAAHRAPSLSSLIHPGGGFDAAGYDQEGRYLVLSRKTGRLVNLAGGVTPSALMSSLGAAYCLRHYGATDARTGRRVFVPQELVAEIRLSCDRFGPLRPDSVRGPGMYIDQGQLVVNYGDVVRSAAGAEVNTTPSPERVYCAGEGIGFGPDTAAAGADDIRLLEQAFGSFSFDQAHGAAVSMGWFASAAMGAVLPHSPSLILTAAAGSGKSTWVDLQAALLRHQVIRRDGVPTVAQVLHAVQDSSVAMMFDEFEPGKVGKREMAKLAEVLNSGFTRSAGRAKFTRVLGGKLQHYNAPAGVALCGIHIPELESALESRSVRLAMTPRLGRSDAASPLLGQDGLQQAEELGARVRRLLVDRWQVLAQSHVAVHRLLVALGHPSRRADTWSPLLAGYVAITNDSVPGEDALEALVASWGLDCVPVDTVESVGEACLRALLDRKLVVRVVSDGRSVKRHTRVREALASLMAGADEAPTLAVLRRHLAMLGVRALHDRAADRWTLAIASSEHHVGARQLFQGTDWARGTWRDALLTLPGAARGQQRFAGDSVKAVVLPAPALLHAHSAQGDDEPMEATWLQ